MFIYLYLHQTQEDNYFHNQVGCILKSVLCPLGPVSDKEFLSVLCNHVHTYWAHSMSQRGTTPDTTWSRQTSVSLNLTWHGDWTMDTQSKESDKSWDQVPPPHLTSFVGFCFIAPWCKLWNKVSICIGQTNSFSITVRLIFVILAVISVCMSG